MGADAAKAHDGVVAVVGVADQCGVVDNNIRNLHNAAIDSVSAIYAQIGSSKEGGMSVAGDYEVGGSELTATGRTPTQPTPDNNNKASSHSNTSSSRSKALAEFRDLMLEVERKRNFRVGLNLFNTQPDVGIDYLVKQGFLELSPVSVAKFLADTRTWPEPRSASTSVSCRTHSP